MTRLRAWVLATMVVVASLGIGLIAAPPAHATPPAMGNRILSIQDSAAETQTEAQALSMVEGSGSQAQNVHTYWDQYEPTGTSGLDFTIIDNMRAKYGSQPVMLRVDPIYSCSRRVPSDLVGTAWDSTTMISRYEALLAGLYNAANPVSGTPLDIIALTIGTEFQDALKTFPSDSSSIDYYLKYQTFFNAVSTYAHGLWGSSLDVGMVLTRDGLVAQHGTNDARVYTTATNSVSASSSTASLSVLPAGVTVGDYITFDDFTASEEIRRVTNITGTTLTLDSPLTYSHAAGYPLVRTLANSLQTLNRFADVVFYTYYPVNFSTGQVKDPTTSPAADMYEAATYYIGRKLGMAEAGFPTSTSLGGSQAEQQAFVQAVFAAWDAYCDNSSCLNPILKYVDFQWATDWDPSDVIHYVGTGCGGTTVPQVSTAATSAASASQNHITFTSAPAYFQNGDTVYLDAAFSHHEETAVISSGGGTTTWTLTANLKYSHAAGYQVLLGGPHAPTAGVTGTTGSAHYGYRIVARNAVGQSLYSDETLVTNGPTTLTGSNYVWLDWTAVPGATSYDIWRFDSTGSPSTSGFLANVSAPTHIFGDTGYPVSSTFPDGSPASNVTQSVWFFLSSLGLREWNGSGTDKSAWGSLCSEAKSRGASTSNC